jgi:hypothetical protein
MRKNKSAEDCLVKNVEPVYDILFGMMTTGSLETDQILGGINVGRRSFYCLSHTIGSYRRNRNGVEESRERDGNRRVGS